jgi:hypothetical protein
MSDPISSEFERDCPEEGRNRAGKGMVLAAGIGLAGLSVAVLVGTSGLGLAWAIAAYLGFPMLAIGGLVLADALSSVKWPRRTPRQPQRASLPPARRFRHV